MVPNVYFVLRYGKMRFDWMGFVVRPALAAAVMSLTLLGFRSLLPSGRLYTMILVVIGILAYMGAVFLFKAVTQEDLNALHLRRLITHSKEE
jgi:hypothetical protein